MKKLFLFALMFSTSLSMFINAENKIPVEHFWCESAMTSGTLSPNGKYFAAMVPASGPKCSIDSDEDSQSTSVNIVPKNFYPCV